MEILVEIITTSIRFILLALFFDLPQCSKLDEHDSHLEGRYLEYALVERPLVTLFSGDEQSGPKKMKACVKIWQTDGVGTKLFFAPNGSAMAASGAHNSVLVCKNNYCSEFIAMLGLPGNTTRANVS